jgi:hypothetical protein
MRLATKLNGFPPFADGALQCVAQLVGGAQISVHHAAEGAEALTLVGSVK